MMNSLKKILIILLCILFSPLNILLGIVFVFSFYMVQSEVIGFILGTFSISSLISIYLVYRNGYLKRVAFNLIASMILLLSLFLGYAGGNYCQCMTGFDWYGRTYSSLWEFAIAQKRIKSESQTGNYANWSELMEYLSHERRNTHEDAIRDYNITLFEVKPRLLNENGEMVTDSSFTIVAEPDFINPRVKFIPYPIYIHKHGNDTFLLFGSEPKYQLRTFAICEDMIPRVWIGKDSDFDIEDINLDNSEQWEIIQ